MPPRFACVKRVKSTLYSAGLVSKRHRFCYCAEHSAHAPAVSSSCHCLKHPFLPDGVCPDEKERVGISLLLHLHDPRDFIKDL